MLLLNIDIFRMFEKCVSAKQKTSKRSVIKLKLYKIPASGAVLAD